MKSLRRFALLAVLLPALPLHAFYPEWHQRPAVAAGNVSAIDTGDFDEDGRPDVIYRAGNGFVALHITKPNGSLTTPAVYAKSGGWLSGPVVADVNGDDHLDAVLGDSSAPPEGPADKTYLVVRPGNGDGTFGDDIITTLSFSPTIIEGGDFNGDGETDLAIWSYASAILAIYTGDGAGHFTEARRFTDITLVAEIETGDIDHDGHIDIALARRDATAFRLYFGNGDATFDAPVELTASNPETRAAALADLDADDDLDILFCDFNDRTLMVAVNNGSRSFASPVEYIAGGLDHPYGDPVDVVAGDVDQDGHTDVLVTLANSNAIATYLGNGNGSLREPVLTFAGFWSSSTIFPHVMALADLTGDSRIDLALGTSSSIGVYENRSGDLDVRLTSTYPTITVGQTAKFVVSLCPAAFTGAPYYYSACNSAPFPVGTIVLKSNGNVIGSGTLGDGYTEIEVPSLPLGAHAITAEFAGDDEYHAAVSPAFEQRVIAEETTVTLTASPEEDVEYGQSWVLTTKVTSPLPDPLNGSFWLFTNGVRSQYTLGGPTAYWYPDGKPPGTYEFYATFEGTAKQPPGKSGVVTKVVHKGRPTARVFGHDVGRYGLANELYIAASTQYTSTGLGIVKLYEGSTLVAAGDAWGDWVDVNLPVGVHYLEAVYEGNEYFEPARSEPFRYTVLPPGFTIDAFATGSNVRVAVYTTLSNGYMRVLRRTGAGGSWFTVGYYSSSPFTDTNVPPGVYGYMVEQYDYSNNLLATSNIDVAIVGAAFSDDPLLPGTIVKAAHLSELLSATNAMRAAAGLSPLTIDDAGPGQPIRAVHLLYLRGAIDQARAAHGLSAVPWTDAIVPNAIIRALHMQELREALR